jgi:NADPH-dependent F420 reductase
MKIAIVGGTGKEGRGMAVRWTRAGHDVWIGSRDAERARLCAEELSRLAGHPVAGGDNTAAVEQAELVVLAVPYSAHRETLLGLKAALRGKILVDITVPLKPPDVRRVALPEGKAAALEAQALLGADTKVVAALHHVSAVHLSDLEHLLDCDVLACSDDRAALELVLGVIQDLGTRAFDAGPLANAVALEALTPVLLHLNRRYKSPGAGIRFTGV